jgi:hypothetical protein
MKINARDTLDYLNVARTFSEQMINELIANHDKGGRTGPNGWLSYDDKLFLNELYYHVGKLQAALKSQDVELIKELSADVANFGLMIYDKYSQNEKVSETASAESI